MDNHSRNLRRKIPGKPSAAGAGTVGNRDGKEQPLREETTGQIQVERIEVPLQAAQIKELFDFWLRFFESSDEDFRDVYTGAELEHNRDVLYLARKGKRIVGAVHLTVSRSEPSLGGLGGVATDPDFRGMGIAARLCELARDDFRSWGGLAIFLGTGNPVAARVYHRCGWQQIAGTNVMVCLTNGDSVESFLKEYFKKNGSVTFAGATAGERVPMIPLIITPHDWQILDANVGIYSTRYVVQKSCMGLYPRYEKISANGKGTWFAARTDQDRLVGLSTAFFTEPGKCQVDGFVHQSFTQTWKDLMQTALQWGMVRGATRFSARTSIEDTEKQLLFESMGFRKVRAGDDFDLDGRKVPSNHLEKK